MARSLAFAALALVLALLATACSKSGAGATRYHCPMHPTYIADRPGDCPICGMRLVPIEEGKHGAHAAAGKAPAAPPSARGAHAHAGAPAGSGATLWTCPMDPEVVSDKPGRCPKCGMALEPKAAPAPAPSGSSAPPGPVPGLVPIDIEPERVKLAGVRTAVAERARLDRTVRTVGIVAPDETRVRHVHTKISGWVEKLYVGFTGQRVSKGTPILSIYSQELMSSQQEYLRAREAAAKAATSSIPEVRRAAEDMLAAARRRLTLFDVPPSFLAELDRTGEPQRKVTLLAPVSGFVTSKGAYEGQQVDPGKDLFTVTDLSRVWIEADFYENEASAVKVGQTAKLTMAYQPGIQMSVKVKYVYPYLNPQTRTLKVRFEFANPDLGLKLGMYANVELPLASSEGIVVPDSAVMDTGLRQIVFVQSSPERFEPRLVKVGLRADGKVEVLSGVAAGEHVVVKANFLLDSESRLRAAIAAPAPSPAPAASEAAP